MKIVQSQRSPAGTRGEIDAANVEAFAADHVVVAFIRPCAAAGVGHWRNLIARNLAGIPEMSTRAFGLGQHRCCSSVASPARLRLSHSEEAYGPHPPRPGCRPCRAAGARHRHQRCNPLSEIDPSWPATASISTAIRARVELVAEALDLPASEVEQAIAPREDQSLIEFADQYGQSIAWLLVGDLQGIVREVASSRCRSHADLPLSAPPR